MLDDEFGYGWLACGLTESSESFRDPCHPCRATSDGLPFAGDEEIALSARRN